MRVLQAFLGSDLQYFPLVLKLSAIKVFFLLLPFRQSDNCCEPSIYFSTISGSTKAFQVSATVVFICMPLFAIRVLAIFGFLSLSFLLLLFNIVFPRRVRRRHGSDSRSGRNDPRSSPRAARTSCSGRAGSRARSQSPRQAVGSGHRSA